MKDQNKAMSLCAVLAVALVFGLAGAVSAATYSGTTVITFSPNPAALSGDSTPDVTITTTTVSGASLSVIDAGKVIIAVATDGAGNPVPAAFVVDWVALNAPGQSPVNGVTTLQVDLDALGCQPGTFVGFRAHYITGGGANKVSTHFGTANLAIEGGYQGLSHGFWKNHEESWVGYEPEQLLEVVFDIPDGYDLGGYTLAEALDFGGGKTLEAKAQLLLMQAVAALLNAADPGINYPFTEAEIIEMVWDVLDAGDADGILALKDLLDDSNNLGL